MNKMKIKIHEAACQFCDGHEVTLIDPNEVTGEITLIRDGDGAEVYEGGRFAGYALWKVCPYCGASLTEAK